MRERGLQTQKRQRKFPLLQGKPVWITAAIILLVLAAAGVLGVLSGIWLSERREASGEYARIDEYHGLGERTGLTGEIGLNVKPMQVAVQAGQPIRVTLTLENRAGRSLILNGWLTPTPADFDSNQFPFKVEVSREGQKLLPHGSPVLQPPHTKGDFFRLGSNSKKDVQVELYPGDGRWGFSTPGSYIVEIWYETYLTGRYAGVNAWTGSTNHVIVQVQVY